MGMGMGMGMQPWRVRHYISGSTGSVHPSPVRRVVVARTDVVVAHAVSLFAALLFLSTSTIFQSAVLSPSSQLALQLVNHPSHLYWPSRSLS